jgi:hypothetical protein
MTYIKLQRMNARAALVAAGGPSRVQREQIIDVLEDVGPMIDWTLMGAERFEDRVRSLLSDLREDE